MTAKKKPKIWHYLVVGRVPYDEEDTAFCTQATSHEEAVDAFTDHLFSGKGGLAEANRLIETGADAVYINHVYRSESPMSAD